MGCCASRRDRSGFTGSALQSVEDPKGADSGGAGQRRAVGRHGGGQALGKTPEIEAASVAGMRAKGVRARIIDVRPASSHRADRVGGAISVPMAQLQSRLSELPADVPLVFYCT